jgi:hypothetical protein
MSFVFYLVLKVGYGIGTCQYEKYRMHVGIIPLTVIGPFGAEAACYLKDFNDCNYLNGLTNSLIH